MPGRFEHLEFDEPSRQESARQQQGTPLATPQGYLAAANEAHRWGRYERALRLFTRCLEDSRGTIPAWVGQVQMLVQLGECHEARLWSDKALELFRNNGDLLAAKAQACIRLKDRRAAFASSDASLRSAGSSPFRWQARGEVMLAKGERTHDACFAKALTEPGADWFDRIVIANIYRFYGKAALAFEYARQATEASPAAGYAWFTLGLCQRSLGLVDQAAASLSRCLELKSDYQEARWALADLASEPLWKRWGRRLFGRKG